MTYGRYDAGRVAGLFQNLLVSIRLDWIDRRCTADGLHECPTCTHLAQDIHDSHIFIDIVTTLILVLTLPRGSSTHSHSEVLRQGIQAVPPNVQLE